MRINIINKLTNRKGFLKMKTRIWNRVFYSVMAIVGALGFSFAPMTKVFATSAYDNVIELGDAIVRCPDNSTRNVSASYIATIFSYTPGELSGTFGEYLKSALEYGSGWALTQTLYSGFESEVTLHVNTTVPSALAPYFMTDTAWPDGVLRMPNTTSIGIYCDPENELALSVHGVANRALAFTNFAYDPLQIKPIYINVPIEYPIGYEGIEAPYEPIDADADGVGVEQEQFMGTSDLQVDTDHDGLSDLMEAPWYSGRADTFCDADPDPDVCAYPDPLKKDIYVEVDWMDSGSKEYKPTGTQLDLVKDMFANKNINVHFDTGEYGGGEELTTYTADLRMKPVSGSVSFADYKDGGAGITANFESIRNNIWHYMIYGHRYVDNSVNINNTTLSDSSGVAEGGGDDLFIAGDVVENASGVESVDLAVASTIAHELGHNLCLSHSVPIGANLPSECEYSGVDDDSFKPINYKSVMNYRYQLTKEYIGSVDYSDGTNGTLLFPDDHDDWSAVMLGMGSFSYNARTGLGSRSSAPVNQTMDSRLIING
jgi:hypothetical protein